MARGLIYNLLFFCFASCTLHAKAQELVAPYLMDQTHPIKADVDTLFNSSRATFNLTSLEEAGFEVSPPRKFTRLIIAKHKLAPGYIFKLYLDVQRYHSDKAEYKQWIARIEGSEKIRQFIQETSTEHLFCVPDAWIYQLPDEPACPEGYIPKRFVLIEQEMPLLPREENKDLWKSDQVSDHLLENLFNLISSIGLDDCLKPDNLPFTEDGRIAFIDTETYDRKVKFKKLTSFLSKNNQKYWKELIKNRH